MDLSVLWCSMNCNILVFSGAPDRIGHSTIAGTTDD
jgi:hypothetical protein